MSKAFFEVFPTLQLEEELKNLLQTTEVTKVSANHDKSHIRIYLLAERIIFKKNIWKIEEAIKKQLFPNNPIFVHVIEKFQLSAQYTPETLLSVYKDSILEELNNYSVLEYNLLRTADMKFEGAEDLLLTLENTIIAQTRTNEIVEFL